MTVPVIHTAIGVLIAWGRNSGGVWLGYPRRNTIHRLMIEGPGASSPTAQGEDDGLTDEGRLINALLAEMEQEYIDVAVARYVHKLSERDVAARLRVSRNEVRRRLAAVHWLVAGGLIGRKTP